MVLCACGEPVLPSPESTTWERNDPEQAPFHRVVSSAKRCSLDCMVQYPKRTREWLSNYEDAAALLLAPTIDDLPDPLVFAGSVSEERLPVIRHADGTPATLATLSDTAEAAQLGVGRKTVTNTNLRNVRRVRPGKVTVEWSALQEVVDAVGREAVPGRRLRAELHDVLIYEEGSFFRRHRDSKKGEGHVMTLSVTALWGGGGGGGGDEGKVVFYRACNEHAPTEVWGCGARGAWGAWFCTQYHEVSPLPRGACRVAVVYNLFLSDTSVAQDSETMAPQGGALSSNLLNALHPFLDKQGRTSLGLTCRAAAAVLLTPEAVAVARLQDTLPSVARMAQLSGKRRLGFVLHHSYSTDGEVAPHPSALRGADALLYHSLCKAYGTAPELRPVTITREVPKNTCGDIWNRPRYTVVPELVEGHRTGRWERNTWQTSYEDDFLDDVHGTYFEGVLWGNHAGHLQRRYKGNMLQGSRHDLHGNQAVFDLYWYRDTAILVDIPFNENGAYSGTSTLRGGSRVSVADLQPPEVTVTDYTPLLFSDHVLQETL
eukprot:Sspe_Gene.117596::Locus_109112_Transcript_1_2_Confidence_0.750_Length_1916::g.117596::m.117596